MPRIIEGEGGKKPGKDRPEIILCREDGAVTLFISIKNGHLQRCGTPGVNWRYMSPLSVCLDKESGRGRKAGNIIEMARCLSKMTGYKLRDELVMCDINGKDK